MIYECKVYKPNGELETIHSQTSLKKRFWDQFNPDPLGSQTSNKFREGWQKSKTKKSRAKKHFPKPCVWCKKYFDPTHSKVKNCSPKCTRQYLNDYFKKRRKLIKNGFTVNRNRNPTKRKNVASVKMEE